MLTSKFSVLCVSILLVLGVIEGAHDKNPVSFLKLSTCREFDIHSSGCQHFFPIENLKNYKSDKFKVHLKFYVMTSNDANVVMTNGKTGADKIEYVAVVAGYANSYSWLRNTNGTTIGLDSHKKDILSPLWPTPIVVSQSRDGEIVVSIPHVTEPLLKGDAKDLDIKNVCFFAWKAASRWFYNCVEDESYFLEETSTFPNSHSLSSAPELDERVADVAADNKDLKAKQ